MKLAFFFPGQGSQSVGMMRGFMTEPVVRATFEEASSVLDVDFWNMVEEPNDIIHQTVNTQPVMLAAGVSIWRLWQQIGGTVPSVMAGHSLGEYTALVASEALSFTDALRLVHYRARIMQDAVPEGFGAMAAILGLADEDVRQCCAEAAQGDVLEAVNFNSPGQVVIAGTHEAVLRGIETMKVHGAKRAMLLPVSVPSHCSLMKSAATKLQTYLHDVPVFPPRIPVLHNADIQSYPEPELIKQALVRQLYSPVRWSETVQYVGEHYGSITAECGPGKVLAGLVKRIHAEMTCQALTDIASLQQLQSQLI